MKRSYEEKTDKIFQAKETAKINGIRDENKVIISEAIGIPTKSWEHYHDFLKIMLSRFIEK